MELQENHSSGESGSGSDSDSDSASTPDIELDFDSDDDEPEQTITHDDNGPPLKRPRVSDDADTTAVTDKQKSDPQPNPEPNLEEDPFAAFDAIRNQNQMNHAPPKPTQLMSNHAPASSSSSSHAQARPWANQSGQPSRPLEPSIFNTIPTDPVARRVAEFLTEHLPRPNVEIEAKLGVLIDKQSNQRIKLAVESETALIPSTDISLSLWSVLAAGDDKWYRFESNMTMDQHSMFNKMLNEQVTRSQHRDYKGAKIQYKHTKECDRFYDVGQSKVRVTTDQATGQVVPGGIVEKVRVANLNVFSPGSAFDYRISVNVEVPVKMPTGTPLFERNKDRLSYTHQAIKFDLTQVKGAQQIADGIGIEEFHLHGGFLLTSNLFLLSQIDPQRANGSPPDMTHELELEFVCPKDLLRDRDRTDGDRKLVEAVGVLINNVRMLNARAGRRR
ncbi:CYTH-like domain-containing protein [Jimgerdemannia flammicorona]|uniref:mRNA-capping enzyme subunit beta n=1 Tax=Jimgerdemannia flammicorona TaxID=994334 RepID=A0A433QWR5_9FUNG|nr:CYTH-like domain-containing protein [Jimgerdemannia flammicorona]